MFAPAPVFSPGPNGVNKTLSTPRRLVSSQKSNDIYRNIQQESSAGKYYRNFSRSDLDSETKSPKYCSREKGGTGKRKPSMATLDGKGLADC